MKTRDKILAASLALYNLRGVATVSNGHIADEMEISPGNLYYYFKNKEQLLVPLLADFESQLSALLNAGRGQVASIEDLWFILHMVFELQEKYCFVLRDQAHLLGQFPSLVKPLQRITQALQRAVKGLCANLQRRGVIDASETELEALSTNVLLVYTQWLSFQRCYNISEQHQHLIALGAYQVLVLFRGYLPPQERLFLDELGQSYLCA